PPAEPAELVALGKETVETVAGTWLTDRYRTDLGSARLDIWAHPKAGPLGIVRLRSAGELLELEETGTQQIFRVPAMLMPLLDGRSTLAHFCDSCHEPGNPHRILDPPR
ncbi:MAG: hypothetical protein MI919_39895, partial [Holophagales bacterium]|nr:hypothetical protein [Holophagales bacterium]